LISTVLVRNLHILARNFVRQATTDRRLQFEVENLEASF
jgi:hypothetical protein